MSIEAVARVLKSKASKGNARLVLIALADYANDDGTGVFPSMPKIAAKANCDERTVERALTDLVELGEIVEVGRTPKGTRAWRVLTGLEPTPDKLTGVPDPDPRQVDGGPPADCRSTPGNLSEPLMEEPSKEPSGEPSTNSGSSGDQLQHPPSNDELWIDDVVEEIFEAWRVGTGKNGNSALTAHRKKKLNTRIEEAMKEGGLAGARAELLEAVAGMVGSTWHRDNGHQEFDQLFRSRETVEKFVTRFRKDGGGGAVPSAPGGQPPPKPEYDTTRPNPELE